MNRKNRFVEWTWRLDSATETAVGFLTTAEARRAADWSLSSGVLFVRLEGTVEGESTGLPWIWVVESRIEEGIILRLPTMTELDQAIAELREIRSEGISRGDNMWVWSSEREISYLDAAVRDWVSGVEHESIRGIVV